MTCIIGLSHKGKVYIGGDSAGVDGYNVSIRADEKVFSNKKVIMGFTSSFKMGQILRYDFTPPKQLDLKDDMQYMVSLFVLGVRECLKKGGFAHSKEGVDSGGTFIVGYQGNLYTIYDDFQVSKDYDGITTIGCGEKLQKGLCML